jgi:hypothetical protein
MYGRFSQSLANLYVGLAKFLFSHLVHYRFNPKKLIQCLANVFRRLSQKKFSQSLVKVFYKFSYILV